MAQFRSTGVKTVDVVRRVAEQARADVPIGIATPLQLGSGADGVFKVHRNVADQIHDNLRNLLYTNWGDRVVQYDFGANLEPLVFELTTREDFDFDVAVVERVNLAISKWMQFVTIDDVKTSVEFGTGRRRSVDVVNVDLTYSVQLLNVRSKQLRLRFFVGG